MKFLAGNPEYEDFFIWYAHEDDLTPAMRSMIFRPRATPILTRYENLGKMIHARTCHPAFHPNGPQRILFLSPKVFAVMRTSPKGDRFVVTLANVTKSRCTVRPSLGDVGGSEGPWRDLLSARVFQPKQDLLAIALQPYDVLRLVPESDIATTRHQQDDQVSSRGLKSDDHADEDRQKADASLQRRLLPRVKIGVDGA
jgi:hypothetical protein